MKSNICCRCGTWQITSTYVWDKGRYYCLNREECDKRKFRNKVRKAMRDKNGN